MEFQIVTAGVLEVAQFIGAVRKRADENLADAPSPFANPLFDCLGEVLFQAVGWLKFLGVLDARGRALVKEGYLLQKQFGK